MTMLVLGHQSKERIEIDGFAEVGHWAILQALGKDLLVRGSDQDGKNGRIDTFQAANEV